MVCLVLTLAQQKYMDLTIQQQAGEEAKKGLANLEKFKFMYEPDDYMRTKMQYEKAIAFGDITADQINSSSIGRASYS